MTTLGTHYNNRHELPFRETSFAEVLEKRARDFACALTSLPMEGKGLSIEYLERYARERRITNLIVLDQKVADVEQKGNLRPYGYQVALEHATITVIDHHVSDPHLASLSTGNLVLEYLRHHPQGPPLGATIAITHGDCDSVIAAGLMVGALPPIPEFGDSVIAADHTFEPNHIADLLQAIELIPANGELVRLTDESSDGRLVRSVELSFRNLGLLLQGKELDTPVADALNGRLAARAAWSERIERGDVRMLPGGTCLCVLSEKPQQDPCPEFLKGLLPDAMLVLVFHQVPDEDDFLQVRAVGGCAFPEFASLGDGSIISTDLVPGFGGRRDAGSNYRGGISFVGDPEHVASVVDARIGELLASALHVSALNPAVE